MTVNAALDQSLSPFPICGYRFDQGLSIAAVRASSTASAPLSAGAYLVTTTADIFLTVGTTPEAGQINGSIFIPSGAAFHVLIREGDAIAARGAAGPAFVSIVPVR